MANYITIKKKTKEDLELKKKNEKEKMQKKEIV